MANRSRARSSRRKFVWVMENTNPAGELNTASLSQTAQLLTTTNLEESVIDREATLVRSHGSFWAGFNNVGSASSDLLVRICIGIAFKRTSTELSSVFSIESSDAWFVQCCVVLSPQQIEGMSCKIDSKAKRIVDTAVDSMWSKVEMDVINGTLPADADVLYGFAGRFGFLTA